MHKRVFGLCEIKMKIDNTGGYERIPQLSGTSVRVECVSVQVVTCLSIHGVGCVPNEGK